MSYLRPAFGAQTASLPGKTLMSDKLQSLGISVYHEIRQDILMARLPPSQKLGLKFLSERYNCGASPIREALNQLTVEGWVVRIDKRGFFVADASPADFADILHNRCFMEGEALRRSIALGGATWEEEVLLTHFRMSNLDRREGDPSSADVAAWETAHRNFHRALISACGSRLMLENCARLYDLNIRYRVLARRKSHTSRKVSEEHDEIKTLALGRDANGAVEALVRHYLATGDFLFPKD